MMESDFFFGLSSGRVLVQEVDAKIQECQRTGISIFFVGITAGTTVLGAFDPIDEVADICQKYGIWLHVDVSEGIVGAHRNGCVLMSRVPGVVPHCLHQH